MSPARAIGALPSPTQSSVRGWQTVLVLALAFCAMVLLTPRHPPAPRADALRYLDYALSLRDHHVFGLTGIYDTVPQPGRANVPLYPALVSLVLASTDVPAAALRCHIAQPARGCAPVPTRVYWVQRALAALTLAGIWLLAVEIGGGLLLASLATATTLTSGQVQSMASQLLTENLSLPLFVFATVCLLRAWRGGAAVSATAGVLLGLLALTRPEFLYLGAAIAALSMLRALYVREAQRVRACAALVLALAATLGPWMARNYVTFGDPALTATYGGQVIAQRVQYNRMSVAELGAAFVYWLPTFGDSFAGHLLPPASYARLDFGPGSYYRDGLAYFDTLAQRTGGDAQATRYIIDVDVLGHPVKHAAVTVALAWRGLFVGKLWGLCGLVAFVYVACAGRGLRGALLAQSGAAWFMLLFYAAISVSVPRYAICLVPTFAIAQALCVERLITRRREARA